MILLQPGVGGIVHQQCKPCAHAILDVWNEGAEILEQMVNGATDGNNSNQTVTSLGLGSELGVVGGHGIYTLASARNKDPELATFRGLQDSAKAALFTHVLTFGQYCKKLKNGELTAANIGDAYAAETYDGGTDATRSFCSTFYEYAAAIGGLDEEGCANAELSTILAAGGGILNEFSELSEDGLAAKVVLDEANAVATAAIADATPIPTTNFDALELCARVLVTKSDLFTFLPDLAADLELYKQFADADPLFPGFFLPVEDETGPAGALHVPGCMLERENLARGENKTANGVPWGHYHIDLHTRDSLRIKPVEVGSAMHQVFDASARQADPTDPSVPPKFRPVLMKWHRPNGAFERHKYIASTIIPGVYDKNQITMLGGDTYRMARVKLAPWTAECERWRNAHFKGLCPASNPFTTAGMSSSVPSFNPAYDAENPTTPWKTTCSGEESADAAKCGLDFTEATQCDYKEERPRRLLMPQLEKYSPEAANFLKRFQITTEDIEEMMGHWAYDNDYTSLVNRIKRRRHAVCDWVKNNRAKWEPYVNTGINTTRCLGEIDYRIDSNGRYIPGIPCSGHGVCIEDKSRDFTRVPYVDPDAAAAAKDNPDAVGDEVTVDNATLAAHEAMLDSTRGPFYAGVCQCDRGYVGDDCLELGEPERGDVGMEDNMGLLMLATTGGCGLFVVFMVVFVLGTRHEPVMAYCSTEYCLLIELSSALALGSFVFWVGTPNFVSCVMRPVSALVSLNLFSGTIFARVYRTTFILWGKSPPNVVITDATYMISILKKEHVPLIILLALFVAIAIFGNVATPARVPQKDYLGYVWCDYGSAGSSVLAAATFYVAMIASWSLADLWYLRKRVQYTSREPFYHGERMDMTRSLIWVMAMCSGGFFFGILFNIPSLTIPDALNVKFLFVTAAIASAALGGTYLIIFPKYRVIYMNPAENIVFKGERFSVPVSEGGGEHNIEPTIDVNDMDPRLLRKNVALLKENLKYADKLGETKEELGRLHKLLLAYERSARAVTPAMRPLTRENVSSSYVGADGQVIEGDELNTGQLSNLGTVSNPSLPPYDDYYYDEEGSWHEDDGMAPIQEEHEGGDAGDVGGAGDAGDAGGEHVDDNRHEEDEDGANQLGDKKAHFDDDGINQEEASNYTPQTPLDEDEYSENLEPPSMFDEEKDEHVLLDDDELKSRLSEGPHEKEDDTKSLRSGQSGMSRQSGRSQQSGQSRQSGKSKQSGSKSQRSVRSHQQEHQPSDDDLGSNREDGTPRSQRSGNQNQPQPPASEASEPSYREPPPFTPDVRGAQSSLDELALSNRLENLLYSTESQAGALLREMDAIRMEREHDRERMRDKTVRLNTMIEKFNSINKKNKKLVRTLHNRQAPLPTVAQILSSQRLSQYERLFAKKKINAATLLSMDDNDLWTTVSMKRGHRRKLLNALKKYLVGPKMPKLPTPAPTPVPSEPSTVRLPEDEEENYEQGGVDGDESKISDTSGGSDDDDSGSEVNSDPSEDDGMGSESEDEHVVDMEGT